MAESNPRPHPAGGFYCEVGTGRHSHGPACQRRATWVAAEHRNDPGKRPGSVVCDEHRLKFPSVYVPLPAPSPSPEGGEGGER